MIIYITKGQRKSKINWPEKGRMVMARLSDSIEEFIKSMMDDYDEMIELQRNELANYFQCAPSQINYVLATRFSPERGYLVESKRGGGGYIKLVRINLDKRDHLMSLLQEKLGKGEITARDAASLIAGLKESGLIDEKQEKIMEAAVSDKAIRIPAAVKDRLRAGILREMRLALGREEE